jgi:hypothetical protein
MSERHLAVNVSAVNEPARADRQGGEAGSRPFPSYSFHGLPGQRAKRASVNPACYPRVTAATSSLQKPELGGPEPIPLAVERIPLANRHPPAAGAWDEAQPTNARCAARAGADPHQRQLSCRYPQTVDRCPARAGFASTGGPTSVLDRPIPDAGSQPPRTTVAGAPQLGGPDPSDRSRPRDESQPIDRHRDHPNSGRAQRARSGGQFIE